MYNNKMWSHCIPNFNLNFILTYKKHNIIRNMSNFKRHRKVFHHTKAVKT